MSEAPIGIIGGSGLGDALREHIQDAESQAFDTPFGAPSSAVLTGKLGDRKIVFVNRHGDGHKLGPSEVPYAANVFALKQAGARSLIASGAVGSLREEVAPKHLVLVDQFIDKTFRRQGSFFGDMGAVHCELAHPTCARLRGAIEAQVGEVDTTTHTSGTYVVMEGPQFSTRAESLMHRTWGGDVIGMTAMPEAKLAREAQLCYALIALPSDYDCWREEVAHTDKQELLAEIIGNLNAATANAIALLEKTLASDAVLSDDECGCRKSLEMAVWTQPDHLDAAARERLGVLFE